MNRLALIHDFIEIHGLKNKLRKRELVYKRYYIYNELREAGLNLMQTAEVFGKNHASIFHGLRMHSDMVRFRDAVYASETKCVADYLGDSKFMHSAGTYRRKKEYNLEQDILEAKWLEEFLRIKRRVKLGIYEKTSTFVGDRAADTSQANQEPGEGGLLCAQIIGNQQAGNS
jgi:hypothetical protein